MPRRLSDDEREVWGRVVQHVRPLHEAPVDGTPDVVEPVKRAFEGASERALEGPSPPLLKPARLLRPPSRPAARITLDLALPPDQALAAQPVRMDAGLHRKMTRGKLVPEARIDLHGMTRDQARAALTVFLIGAHGQGKRLVLAITGKGREGGSDDLAPVARRPGALRHDLPHWLNGPPLRPLVLDLRPAHRTHGGAGAFYIYLRRAG